MIHNRKASSGDQESIWQIIRQVISGGESYVDACIMWRKP